MTFFQYNDYRPFLRDTIKKQPNHGRGEINKIAASLKVNSTWISQILNGSKQFNIDQVVELGKYFSLSEIEIDYFILLVEQERAGNYQTKRYIKKKIDQLKSKAQELSQQVNHERALNEEEKSIFYSSWLYSAIQLFTSTQTKGVSLEQIVKTFEITRPRAMAIVDFLSRSQLILRNGDLYVSGSQSTFINRESPHINKHHTNWRIKSLEKVEQISEEEMMFTAPISLSQSDFKTIREELVESIKKISLRVKDSSPERIANLNIDLFWVTK